LYPDDLGFESNIIACAILSVAQSELLNQYCIQTPQRSVWKICDICLNNQTVHLSTTCFRETLEETGAKVQIDAPYAHWDVSAVSNHVPFAYSSLNHPDVVLVAIYNVQAT
jgi:hypothetical protein